MLLGGCCSWQQVCETLFPPGAGLKGQRRTGRGRGAGWWPPPPPKFGGTLEKRDARANTLSEGSTSTRNSPATARWRRRFRDRNYAGMSSTVDLIHAHEYTDSALQNQTSKWRLTHFSRFVVNMEQVKAHVSSSLSTLIQYNSTHSGVQLRDINNRLVMIREKLT